MAYEREITVHGRRYRQLVEARWDPKKHRSFPHVLQHLGPVDPVHPHPAPGLLPTSVPAEPLHVATLALRMAQEPLTAHEVLEHVRGLAPHLPLPDPERLQAVGIRYDLGKKLSTQLLLWTSSPSAPSPRARPARRPGSPAAPTPPRPSRSKGD